MAMNKKEAAEFEAMKKAVLVARALNWTEPVAPDVPPPDFGMEDTTGFICNAYSSTILYARSSSIYHATSMETTPTKVRSQGSRSLYSTKLLALRALRHAVEIECAKRLAGIDMQIQQEVA